MLRYLESIMQVGDDAANGPVNSFPHMDREHPAPNPNAFRASAIASDVRADAFTVSPTTNVAIVFPPRRIDFTPTPYALRTVPGETATYEYNLPSGSTSPDDAAARIQSADTSPT